MTRQFPPRGRDTRALMNARQGFPGALQGRVRNAVPIVGKSKSRSPVRELPSSGGTSCRTVLEAGGGETVIDLHVIPVPGTEQVFVNGLLLTPEVDYLVSGTEITLDDPLVNDDRVIVAYQSVGTCGVGELVTPPFDPMAIPGLVLWLDAGDLELTLADGDEVATWEDRSFAGNDADQASPGYRPLLKTGIVNGKPVVRFDGSDDYLNSTLPMSPAARTMVAVVKPGGGTYRALIAGDIAGSLEWRLDDGTNYQALVKEYVAGIGTSTDAVTSAFHVLAFTYADGSSYAFQLDGSPSGSGSHSQVLTTGSTAKFARAWATVTQEIFGGDLAEIFAYDAVLDPGDLAALTAWLQAKYAL